MTAGERRLERIRELGTTILARLGGRIAVRLWDGTRIPAEAPPGAPCLSIADEGALAAMLKRPSLETIIQLYAKKRLDLVEGDFFALAAAVAEVKPRELFKGLRPLAVLRAALPFLAVPGNMRVSRRGLSEGGTPEKNRANIAHHYDVSNAFYALFLDPQMVYSCAYFPQWDADIATAQTAKLEHICRKLRLQPGESFLDVGCGWGALICHAAEHHGVNATGITISQEQHALAQERIRARGLEDKVKLVFGDWTTLSGSYDKIASVGMFEHVGMAHHEAYFRKIRSLLRPRGAYLHHAITRPGKITEAKFRKMRPEYKAILRHVFPGAELDHIGLTVRHLEATGFEVHDVEGLREHYARTTELWCRALMARREEAAAIAGEEITRLWIAYLAGVSLGFRRGSIGIFQTLATSRTRGLSGLPPTRADFYR